ncbi:MAG: LacI family DNA-binding transcriptional regulator [Akkermansiaceae bacterium]
MNATPWYDDGQMSRPNTVRAVSQTAIAKKAGVARTTVSLALRGGEGLNSETIERVMAAAETLGYRPNNLVQAIRSGKSGLIGVMVPPHDSYWSDILHGIHDTLVKNDHVPLVLWPKHRQLQPDEESELKQVNRLIDWRVDGAILWPWYANLYRTHITELRKRDLPLVTIDSTLPDSFHADAVLSDERLGTSFIAEHLLGLGHRQILHFAGPNSEAWSHDRRDAFTEAIRREPSAILHSVELPLTIPRPPFIREAMLAVPQATAIFAATDEIAAEVYQIAAALGRSIPADLSVVGYGDVATSAFLKPALTSVRHCPYRMGKMAASLLLDRISGKSDQQATRVERLPVEFVLRDSTAPPPR